MCEGESTCTSTPPLSPAVQSLDWETFEQYCAWQLFLAHNIPLETIIPILQHLKYKGESGSRQGALRERPPGPSGAGLRPLGLGMSRLTAAPPGEVWKARLRAQSHRLFRGVLQAGPL